MDRAKRSLFMDPMDEVIENNLSSLQLNSDDFIDDKDTDIAILESLIFPDTERSYQALDEKTSEKLHKALRKTFSNDTASNSCDIQCSHCNEIFVSTDFQFHVCQYDENHRLLPTVANKEENEIEKINRCTRELLDENQTSIANLLGNGIKDPQCFKCCRKFVNEAGLMRHYEKHVGQILDESPPENVNVGTFVVLCLVCGAVFGKPSEAWDHLQSDHIEVQDSGEYLKDMASSFSCDVSHEMVIQCEFCDLSFVNVKTVLFHEACHDSSSGFSCNTCELRTLSLKEILLHRRHECILTKDIRNPLKDFPRVWVCNTCEKEFLGLEQLIKHRYDEFHFFPRFSARCNKIRFTCERCLDEFKTASEITEHFKEKYQENNGNEAEAAIGLTSDRVEQPPTRMRKGGIHQTSTRPRQYLCHVCGKSYTQSSHLWQHLRFHDGIKPFACSVEGCERRFTIRPDLNDHVRKCHTGERPYLCEICDKRFLTGSVFYQHRLIHRGERRYGCEECGKRFYRADALKNHERIHTGEKPHSCHECGKKFRQRGDRDKHMKTRHPNVEVIASPRKPRIKSFGRGRIKNNTSLYSSMPPTSPV